jgi:Ran GTPase-activating protein (RanGAP) involved in mRNA processing and transport
MGTSIATTDQNSSSTLTAFLALLEKDEKKTVNTVRVSPYYGDQDVSKIAHLLESSQHVKVLDVFSDVQGPDEAVIPGRDCLTEYGVFVMAQMLTINISIVTVNLCRNKVNDAGAVALAEMLKLNRTLQSLNLKQNCIGDKGAVALAEALKCNTTLCDINLHGNDFSSVGLYAVLTALHTNSSIRSFDFPLPRSHNGIRSTYAYAADEMERIKEMLKHNHGITHVQFKDVYLKTETLKHLVQGLNMNTKVQNVSFHNNYLATNDMILFEELLRTNTCLQTLSIQENRLCIQNIDVVNSWALPMTVNSTLRSLSLSDCGDASNPQQLHTLCQALRENTVLRTLKLECNGITGSGAILLADMLAVNRGIAHLSLRFNLIGSDGLLAFAKMLRVNSTLQTLDLDDGLLLEPSWAEASSLATEEQKEQRKVSLGFQHVCAKIALREFCQALATNYTLSTLGLASCEIDRKLLSYLSNALLNNTGLTSLNLAQNDIDNQAAISLANALQHNTTLCNLNLHRNPGADKKFLLLLLSSGNKTIRKLKLNTDLADTEQGELLYIAAQFQRTRSQEERELLQLTESYVQQNRQYFHQHLLDFLSLCLPIQHLAEIVVEYVALVLPEDDDVRW